MRFLNNSITAVILTALVSLTGCGGSKSATPDHNPPNNPPNNQQSYGSFRALRASAQSKANQYESASASSNQSVTMSAARQGHKSVDIGNGKFLIFGGEADIKAPSVFDEFDSATERFTALSTVTARHRYWVTFAMSYAMLRLPNGKILISGGVTDSCDILEVFDPVTRQIEPLHIGSSLYNNTSEMFNIGNGKVLMFGLSLSLVGTYTNLVGNGVLDTNTWEFRLIDTPEKVHGISAVQLEDGSIIYAGGITDVQETSKSIYRIDPSTLITVKIGELQTARGGHSITVLSDGDIGIYGGITRHGIDGQIDRLSSVEVISTKPETLGITTIKAPFLIPRSFTTGVLLQNGYVLNAGGVSEDGSVASSEFVHNHILNISGTTGSLVTPRRMYSAIQLNNGRVLISGGSGRTPETYNTAEIYDPAQKIIIKYDSSNEVTLGTVVHFSSENSDVAWSCTSKGSIDSNGALTTLNTGNITVTGKNSTGEASVIIKVIAPAE